MSAWGREDESSSSISTTSSSRSRRQESDIDVMAVRNRIVGKIMAKRQREEAERSRNTNPPDRRSRVPLADLDQSQPDMELTQRASTSSDAANLNWTIDSAHRKSKIYSSTPMPESVRGQRQSASTSAFVAPKPKTPAKKNVAPRPSIIPEDEPEEPVPKAPTQVKKKMGRPKKNQPPPQRPRSPSPSIEAPAFEDSENEAPPRVDDDAEEEEEPPRRQTARKSTGARTPSTSQANRSSTAPARTPSTSRTDRPRAASSKKTPSKSTQRAVEEPSQDPGPSTSRAESGTRAAANKSKSRRKATPKRTTPAERMQKAFKEIRNLQDTPGFLIPRLPFMRVVRELAQNVARETENFRFTVDAMEALQTATEYYLTGVFTDAAALANHARRVTVMPRDLDLLRKLRIVDF